MNYLKNAAEQLDKARYANEARVDGKSMSWLTGSDVPILIEVNNRRMELAASYTRLAEASSAEPPDDVTSLGRTAHALKIALDHGASEGDRSKMWVIDQMVKALTGCQDGAESGEYSHFLTMAGTWDEGIAP